MKTFEQLNLSQPILKILAKNHYKEPTPIQQKALPLISAGKDIIAKAPTGTGKTLVFALAALEQLLHNAPNTKAQRKPRILILAPTRELAAQIAEVFVKLGRDLRINIASILGGMPYRKQLQELSRCDVIIATPGRLIDLMERNDGSIDFSRIEMLVLDEADRMLDMGFIDDVKFIAEATPKKRQTLLFTATLDHRLVKLAGNILKSPEHIEVEHGQETLDNITQRVYIADDNSHKIKLLKHLLQSENIYKAIIFSATKRNADELVKQLSALGHSAAALHGDMRQHKRNSTLRKFKNELQLLIATDVAARGIDVTDISHVFIYDLSKFAEDHVHRIGRTGRAGKKGVAISLALPSEGVHLQKIERLTKKTIPRSVIAGLEPRRSISTNSRSSGSKPKSFGKTSAKPAGRFSPHAKPKSGSRSGSGYGAKKPAPAYQSKKRETFGRSKPRKPERDF